MADAAGLSRSDRRSRDSPYQDITQASWTRRRRACRREPASVARGRRWWLRGVTRAGVDAGKTAVERRSRRWRGSCRRSRASVRSLHRVRRPRAGGRPHPRSRAPPTIVVSLTRAREAAECPFRYFLRAGPRGGGDREGERDRDVWLDPLIRGSTLHDIYAALLRRCRDAGAEPALEQDQAWLQQARTADAGRTRARDAGAVGRGEGARDARLPRRPRAVPGWGNRDR